MNPDVINIKSGNLQVKSVYSGEEKVWPQSFIDVKPKYLFFSDMESSGIVDVIANVDWNVKVKVKL